MNVIDILDSKVNRTDIIHHKIAKKDKPLDFIAYKVYVENLEIVFYIDTPDYNTFKQTITQSLKPLDEIRVVSE
jgi:CRISPR/Cas system CSM-associated protein Csm4 (group 5 of RAMP superfamily)